MPRPNPQRQVTHEVNLAKRIQHEREKRDLTYERLAQRMVEAGCPIQPSAIYKIEKGQPRRKISVDEFMVFAEVFDLDPNDLLLPPELALTEELRQLVRDHYEAVKVWRPTWERVLETKRALAKRVRGDDAASAALEPILREAMSEKTARLVGRELFYTREQD